MKTLLEKNVGYFSNLAKEKIRNKTFVIFQVLTILVLSLYPQVTDAHCDSYDGPVIKEAIKSLESKNVNFVLKWVDKDHEKEITNLFEKTYKLRTGDREIYKIVKKHFFETLVRLHRATEGVGYTGLKPAGSASRIVQMADNSIASESVDNLATKFTAHIDKVVKEKYGKVMKLSKVKNESLKKGREYVAAYVDYTHTLEGIHSIIEHKGSAHHEH